MALVKYNNNSISAITTAGTMSASMVLIKEQTASSSSTISFVDGSGGVVLDSTYPIYLFKFINIHPSTPANLEFNATTDGTNFNIVKTSSAFYNEHEEDGGSGQMGYSGIDEAQATGFQQLTTGSNPCDDNDGSIVGTLKIFAPSDTTFVKHFISRTTFMGENNTDRSSNSGYVAGYFNTTSALTGFQFKMRSGNLDAGTIKLYGIKDS
tara:strand:+ start:1526 stop:2152 length:627 start_codon:yes stop_codon:yes gene_type:complete